MALCKGFPVNLSHKRVVSRWFVTPIVIIDLGDMFFSLSFSHVTAIVSLTFSNISSGSCSTHPSFKHILVVFIWWLATGKWVFDENTYQLNNVSLKNIYAF